MWIISKKCWASSLSLITVCSCYADKDVRSGTPELHANVSRQLEWFIMALQEHASVWANSVQICIKDITFLLPVWNIFCLFCPFALPSHANDFIFCDVLPDAPLLIEMEQVFFFLQCHHSFQHVSHQPLWFHNVSAPSLRSITAPPTPLQIRCQFKLTPAQKKNSCTLIYHVGVTTRIQAGGGKLSADPFLCFDFLCSELQAKKKDHTSYFHPIFHFKDIHSLLSQYMWERIYVLPVFHGGKILFSSDMACTEKSDCW